MNSRTFFAAAAVLSVIVLAALSAALPSALLPGNTAYAQTNSAPQFPSSETGTRTVDENTPWYQNIGDPVVATDLDDDKLTYSLENARTSPFTIDRFTGQLQTGAPLDYETQATYTVKVIATDTSDAKDTIAVTINVNNVDEPGKVSLTWTRLQAGAEVEASLTDPDGNVSGVTWHWEKSSDESSWTAISTATQATYTPVEGDVNRYLRAVASYTDLLGAGKTAWSAAASVKPVPDPNESPDFGANNGGGYDCDEDETADVCLSIRRHTPPGSEIHYPGYVHITDNDQIRYTIGGADAAKFRIGPLSGDLYTTDAHAYDNPGDDGKFEITITATDPSGQSGSIDVALRPSGSVGSPTVRGPEEIRYPENGTWPLATYSATASNPDGDIRDISGWIISVEPGGGGGDFFDIDDDGVLTFTHPPDYEDPADENGDNTYSFTIMAYDTNPPSGRRPGRTSFRVRVTVADVNEPPEFSVETASRTIAENTEAGVAIGAPVTANDPDTGDTPAYTLGGTDATFFDIDTSTGQLRTKAALDYEAKSGYTVTVTASDGALTATIDVTITVADVDEAGTVTLSTDQPPARAEITAALTDPDEGVSGAVWQWERSSDGNTGWAGIGTSSPSYTPVDGDVGYHLRATASYTDVHGPGKTAQAASTQTVQAGANRPPEFDSATAAREVPENTEAGGNIGAPVTATDPDTGDTPAYTLGGTDANFFDIDASTGQLQTKAALDYETKSSYTVTVAASDGALTATVDVTVTITNIDEAGTVALSTDQPAARAEITAALTDPDEGVSGAVWQWERSSDGSTGWAGIGTGSPSHTPVDGDLGYHLRATASYTDGHGPGKTAQAASTQAVQAGANRPPEFDSATAAREVPENTEAGENIGAPVTATDPDTGDTPAYTLEGADLDSFDIDSASGQIQTKSGVTYDHESKSSYSVTVKADDNNGGTATIDVTITVADVDEAGTVTLSTDQPPARAEITAALTDPDEGVSGAVWQWERSSDGNTGWAGIGTSSPSYTPVDGDVGYHLRATASYTDVHGPGKTAQAASTQAVQAGANRPPEFDSATATREVPENTEAGENIGAPVTATDPDTGDTPAYTLEGADLDSFDIDSASGQIQTKSGVTYDHESKSSYSVTVKADDNNGGTATIDVTITVADVDEAGTVTLSTDQPPARAEITAALTDPDEGVTGAVWQWERSSDGSTGWVGIGTSSPSHTPVDGDVGYHLRATASYTDVHGPGKTAQAESTQAVQAGANRPPEFDSATAAREVPENTEAGENIGAPVTATDPDTGDTPAYTLEGADLDSFDIDSASGQIQTKSGVTYDHESKSSYSVTVKADDNNGGTATIDVTITVTDVDEPPEFSVETASRTIAENTTTGVAIGDPVTANDPDTGDTPAYTLGGSDAAFFDIDASTGQLRTKAALDHETKSGYTVTVTASDGTLTATVDVTVTVTNIDEAGTVTLSTDQPPARAEITAALTDPDEGVSGAVWQWERSSDGNTGWAGIGTGSPSYTPVDGDLGYHLRATASYTDVHGPGKTAQAASTQAVQAGANRPPEFDSATATREVPANTEAGENIGDPVTATDPDNDTLTYTLGGVDADSFDIGRSTGQITVGAGTTLVYETKSSYTVSVTAADPSGSSAVIGVTIAVFAEDLGELGSRYDTDSNKMIGRDEAITAIIDYFADRITRDELLGVITLYIAS